MRDRKIAYWGDQMSLINLKGCAWHNSLSARKNAYERAMRLKQEVEKRLGEIDV